MQNKPPEFGCVYPRYKIVWTLHFVYSLNLMFYATSAPLHMVCRDINNKIDDDLVSLNTNSYKML